jgi:hypothetical protein
MYMSYKLIPGNDDADFVALAEDAKGPTIPIQDDSPVVAVRYVPKVVKRKRIYRKSELLSEWDKHALEAVKASYKEMNEPYPPPKKTRRNTKASKSEDSSSSGGSKTPKYKETTIPEKWWAKLANGHTKIVVQGDLIYLFGYKYVQEVKARGRSASTASKFIDVPVGAVREPRRLTLPSLCVPSAPPVFYQQGMYDTCVFSSMASALYFAGAKVAANFIQNKAKGTAGCNVQNMFHKLVMMVRETDLKFLSTTSLPPTFDWEHDLHDNMIVVASLAGSDGSVHHAITMFRGWIFDSNETHALPLNKQALHFMHSNRRRDDDDRMPIKFC